jgi:hypothetical protein
VGRTTEPLLNLGLLDGKSDMGYHAEATPPAYKIGEKGLGHDLGRTAPPAPQSFFLSSLLTSSG